MSQSRFALRNRAAGVIHGWPNVSASHCSALVALSLLILVAGCSDPEQIANKAYVELAQDITKASGEPDPITRYAALSALKIRVDQFLSQHARTAAAVRVSANEKIGSLNRAELEDALRAAAEHPVVCQSKPSPGCIAGIVLADYEAAPADFKRLTAATVTAIFARAGDAQKLKLMQDRADASRRNGNANSNQYVDHTVAGFYLANVIRSQPDNFWETTMPVIAPFFPTGGQVLAFRSASQQLLGSNVTVSSLNNFDRVLAKAGDRERRELVDKTAYDRSYAPARLQKSDIHDNFDKIPQTDLAKINIRTLPIADQARILDRLTPDQLFAIPLYSFSLPQIDRSVVERAVVRMASNLSKQQEGVGTFLSSYGHEYKSEEWLKWVALADINQRCFKAGQEIVARLGVDLEGARVISKAAVSMPNCNKELMPLLSKLSEEGYTDNNNKLLKNYMEKEDMAYSSSMPLAISSKGAFPVKSVIDRLFSYVSSSATTDARASLSLTYENSRIGPAKSSFDKKFTPEESRYYAKSIINLNDQNRINSSQLAELATQLRSIGENSLADEALAKALKMSPSDFYVVRTAFAPIIKKQLQTGDAAGAVAAILNLPSDNQPQMIEELLDGVDRTSKEVKDFYVELSRKAPLLLGQIVASGIAQSDFATLEYTSLAAEYEKSKGRDGNGVYPAYLAAILRSADQATSAKIFFTTNDTIKKYYAAYSFVDRY